MIFFLVFPRKQDLTFHANWIHWRQFLWNVKTCFLWKIKKKKISICCLLKILLRVLSSWTCILRWCCYVFQKHSLMDHVAHQTIVMQFILELSRSMKVDPRQCVRAFFNRYVWVKFDSQRGKTCICDTCRQWRPRSACILVAWPGPPLPAYKFIGYCRIYNATTLQQPLLETQKNGYFREVAD